MRSIVAKEGVGKSWYEEQKVKKEEIYVTTINATCTTENAVILADILSEIKTTILWVYKSNEDKANKKVILLMYKNHHSLINY